VKQSFQSTESFCLDQQVMCFNGQGDTHKYSGERYKTISLRDVFAMVKRPGAKSKDKALALMASSYCEADGRAHATQQGRGQFVLLRLDIDRGNTTMTQLLAAMKAFTGDGVAIVIYSTSSATASIRKWRGIIALREPIAFPQWHRLQRALHLHLTKRDIQYDGSMERAGQYMVAPNKTSDFWEFHVNEGSGLDVYDAGVEQSLAELDAKDAEVAKAVEEARSRSADRKARQVARGSSGGSSGLIEAYKAKNSVAECFSRYGFDTRNDSDWHHPQLQTSGSYSWRDFGDYWVCASASALDHRIGAQSASGFGFGDAFDLFTHFEHAGDFNAAVKAAARQLTITDPSTGEIHSWDAWTRLEWLANQNHSDWPELADPFAKYAVPAFPVDALPEEFATLCRELSAQSGFDVGGYAFALLVTASSLIDHQKKMNAGPLAVPAYLWGGLVANSGGGKSPTLNAVSKAVRRINAQMEKESERELAAWVKLNEEAKGEDRKNLPRRPAWRQLIASDTTVEALGALLKDNPTGMLLAHDELTEFIGRMDAYSGNGSGKDRGVYLRSFDGGNVTINRAPPRAPMVISNFSVGIVTGIQPEKLGELFKKSGGGADGLYQRFLVYAMQPAGRVNYAAKLGMFTETNVGNLINQLFRWTEDCVMDYAQLCDEALPLMQDYHQQMRTLAQREVAKRFAEHLDKFPGFLARVTFALHCMECAAIGVYSKVVGLDTFLRAKRIMQTLYHHSAAVYEVLDSQSGEQHRLVKSACEAILARGWQQVSSGDLTRYATNWQGSDDRLRDSSLDTLIELGWLRDVTPDAIQGKRGRRSSGLFLVNPKVHQHFAEQSARIKSERAERFKAIQAVAASRAGEKAHE
jgi:hypothetical protein